MNHKLYEAMIRATWTGAHLNIPKSCRRKSLQAVPKGTYVRAYYKDVDPTIYIETAKKTLLPINRADVKPEWWGSDTFLPQSGFGAMRTLLIDLVATVIDLEDELTYLKRNVKYHEYEQY